MRITRQLAFLAMSVSLTVMAYAQQNQPHSLAYAADKANVPDAIAKLKSGDFAPVHVEMITKAGAVEAIPVLEEQFRRKQDPLLKAKIASALVRLGVKDDTYWDLLAKEASEAVESDAPDFTNVDSPDKPGTGPSPAFVAWANARGKDVNSAGEDSMYILPGKLIMLAATGDPRAIPLLRRGLSAPNHMIEITAAMGLAELQDKDSIPLIIDACKKAPAGAAPAIAESLVYFDDPDAQTTVDKYVSKERATILRESKAHGRKTPFSY